MLQMFENVCALEAIECCEYLQVTPRPLEVAIAGILLLQCNAVAFDSRDEILVASPERIVGINFNSLRPTLCLTLNLLYVSIIDTRRNDNIGLARDWLKDALFLVQVRPKEAGRAAHVLYALISKRL